MNFYILLLLLLLSFSPVLAQTPTTCAVDRNSPTMTTCNVYTSCPTLNVGGSVSTVSIAPAVAPGATNTINIGGTGSTTTISSAVNPITGTTFTRGPVTINSITSPPVVINGEDFTAKLFLTGGQMTTPPTPNPYTGMHVCRPYTSPAIPPTLGVASHTRTPTQYGYFYGTPTPTPNPLQGFFYAPTPGLYVAGGTFATSGPTTPTASLYWYYASSSCSVPSSPPTYPACVQTLNEIRPVPSTVAYEYVTYTASAYLAQGDKMWGWCTDCYQYGYSATGCLLYKV